MPNHLTNRCSQPLFGVARRCRSRLVYFQSEHSLAPRAVAELRLVRPMRVLLSIIIAVATMNSCEKPTARFHPGDKVRVKLSGTEGINSPFVDDLYYLQVPGDERVRYPPHTWDGWYTGDLKPWHYEGPYYESDLVLAK